MKQFAAWELTPGARTRFTVDVRPWLVDGALLTVFQPTAPADLTIEPPTITGGLDVTLWLSCSASLARGKIFVVPVQLEDDAGERTFQQFQVQLV
jgi:hypothetical protein